MSLGVKNHMFYSRQPKLQKFHLFWAVSLQHSNNFIMNTFTIILKTLSDSHIWDICWPFSMFVCFSKVFLRSTCRNVLFFLRKVRVSSDVKIDKAEFSDTNLTLRFSGQKCPKYYQNQVFQVSWNSAQGFFLIFYIKLNWLKWFLREKSCFQVFGSKGSRNGPKVGFFKFH